MKTLNGLAIFVLLFAFQSGVASGQTLTNLYTFSGYPTGGEKPECGLVQGSDGDFYGTTAGGGTNNAGTVFKISPSGSLTNLYVCNVYDGGGSTASLVQGGDGYFYGTTWQGGGSTNCSDGCGIVFRVSSTGNFTNLHSFNGSDGARLQGGLVQGGDGNFYGTTSQGGANNAGTVFKMTPSGNLTTLYQFGGVATDGYNPPDGLVQGSDGNFYGTTQNGGTNNLGTVFKITSTGSLTTIWQFGSLPNNVDGKRPYAGLVQGGDGNFYGTTDAGGTNHYGTVFKITPSGNLTTLYQFGGVATDGLEPRARLVQGSDGNFYGTTIQGGTNGNAGTVFQITPSGNLTTLYQFSGIGTDGNYPLAGLVQGSDGNFYGTTHRGGGSKNCTGGCGTIFKLSVPPNPPPYPINQISGIQLSGTDVIIAIPSMAGKTYQLQFCYSLTDGNWTNVPGASVSNSPGDLLTVTNFGGAVSPQGFYRFAITP